MKNISYFTILFLCVINFAIAKETQIQFGDIDKSNSLPLMEALSRRETNRDFSDKVIDNETLGKLLWATAGVNRNDGKKTYPTARNTQDIELYVIKNDGSWLYNPNKNNLTKISNMGIKDKGAIELVYVANLKKAINNSYSSMHAGSMYQNAGLYCASVGLNNVVKGMFDEKEITSKLKLNKDQKIIITQKIGWAKV